MSSTPLLRRCGDGGSNRKGLPCGPLGVNGPTGQGGWGRVGQARASGKATHRLTADRVHRGPYRRSLESWRPRSSHDAVGSLGMTKQKAGVSCIGAETTGTSSLRTRRCTGLPALPPPSCLNHRLPRSSCRPHQAGLTLGRQMLGGRQSPSRRGHSICQPVILRQLSSKRSPLRGDIFS